ncbi:MAG: bifunctional precorrin-2 dehydrogenase/sirohydrochlorin ferrochelatase [Chitinivibrionales bacterium]|nr:bifunctional precorrin-2 dehydrogenase/sirohydrochlorin ferrochelatase [Chitinivibrionales bacterium]
MYPIYLKLTSTPCLVVGGGKVAERKIAALLDAGATVTVVAPQFTHDIETWAREDKIFALYKRIYKKGEAAHYFCIIAATNDSETNRTISKDARECGKLVNVVDTPDLCNFYVPSIINRGRLQIAISTAGSFPGMSKKIRKELEPLFTGQHARLMDILAGFHTELKRKVDSHDQRMLTYAKVVDSEELQEFLDGNESPLERLLQQCI